MVCHASFAPIPKPGYRVSYTHFFAFFSRRQQQQRVQKMYFLATANMLRKMHGNKLDFEGEYVSLERPQHYTDHTGAAKVDNHTILLPVKLFLELCRDPSALADLIEETGDTAANQWIEVNGGPDKINKRINAVEHLSLWNGEYRAPNSRMEKIDIDLQANTFLYTSEHQTDENPPPPTDADVKVKLLLLPLLLLGLVSNVSLFSRSSSSIAPPTLKVGRTTRPTRAG
jgi:hypothetical protein